MSVHRYKIPTLFEVLVAMVAGIAFGSVLAIGALELSQKNYSINKSKSRISTQALQICPMITLYQLGVTP